MTGLLSQVPGRLIAALLADLAVLVPLSILLARHGFRRLLDVPRVPRPAVMYVVLGGAWLALLAASSTAVAAIALLRDYRAVDQPTALAEVRCSTVDGQRVQLELRAGPLAAPEQYDVDRGSCVVWVKQVELRPGLQPFGMHALSRVEAVGSAVRPVANPGWLTPRSERSGAVDLVVRQTTTVPVAVPLDAHARQVVISSPSGPVLQQSPI